jgi:hypothetical protein
MTEFLLPKEEQIEHLRTLQAILHRPRVHVIGTMAIFADGPASVPAICFVVEIAIPESATIRPDPSARITKAAALVKC